MEVSLHYILCRVIGANKIQGFEDVERLVMKFKMLYLGSLFFVDGNWEFVLVIFGPWLCQISTF